MARPSASKYRAIADREEGQASAAKLRISFEYLDLDSKEFFVHGLDCNFYKLFFGCLDRIQQSSEREIREQTHPSLAPKSIFNGKSRLAQFPQDVVERVAQKLLIETEDLEDATARALEITKSHAFEVRVTKANGRLHGFLWSNAFHLIWIDPLHNLHPRSADGVRGAPDHASGRVLSIEEVNALRTENQKLVSRCRDYEKSFAEQQEILDLWMSSGGSVD